MKSLRFVGSIALLVVSSTVSSGERCAVIFKQSDGSLDSALLPTLTIDALAPEQPLTMPKDTPGSVQFIQCGRKNLVPGPNDYKSLLAGYPLSIVTGDRIGVLEITSGSVHFRMLKGEISELEVAQVREALDAASRQINLRSGAAP